MKKFILCLSVFSMLLCGTALAQQRTNRNGQQNSLQLPSNITSRQYAEILQYMQQLQSHNDPKQIVLRNAQLRADQRRARIATRKWYGYSSARPIAAVTPYMGIYSPIWGVGGRHHSTATIYIAPDTLRR